MYLTKNRLSSKPLDGLKVWEPTARSSVNQSPPTHPKTCHTFSAKSVVGTSASAASKGCIASHERRAQSVMTSKIFGCHSAALTDLFDGEVSQGVVAPRALHDARDRRLEGST